MSVWGWITGGAKSADKAIDAIINTGDKAFFTKEERSERDEKQFDRWLHLQELLAKESLPQATNRRVLAWGVAAMCAFLTFITLIAKAFGADEFAKFTLETATEYHWPWAFTAVISLYFLTHISKAARGKGDGN